MPKVVFPVRAKFKGEWQAAGTEVVVSEKDLDKLPKSAKVTRDKPVKDMTGGESDESSKEEKPLEDMTQEELYDIMQKMDINGRSKIKKEGNEAMIAAIREAREG